MSDLTLYVKTWVGHYSWGLLTGLLSANLDSRNSRTGKKCFKFEHKRFIIKKKRFFLEFVLATKYGRFSFGIKPRLLMSCHAQ